MRTGSQCQPPDFRNYGLLLSVGAGVRRSSHAYPAPGCPRWMRLALAGAWRPAGGGQPVQPMIEPSGSQLSGSLPVIETSRRF